MSKSQLSKSVMSMRFMQKKESVQKISLTDDSSPTKNNIKNSFTRETTPDIYSTLPGRRSFGGCNKPVEKYYKELVDEKYMTYKSFKKEKKNDTIDDEEFHKRQKDLLKKGTSTKRKRNEDEDEENNKNIIQVSSKKIKKGKFVV